MAARIIWTVLRYPVGCEVCFADEFMTEYRTVEGYQYVQGAFYVLLSGGNMVHMDRLAVLAVPVRNRKENTRCKRAKK